MTSPHHLHAIRTTWALHTALHRLTELTTIAARQRVDGALAAATALRAPIYGVRHATGGHADPVSARLDAPDSTGDAAGWADLHQRAVDRLNGIARMFRATDHADPVTAIHRRIPHLLPGTSAVLTRHLVDEDAWIRAAVRLAPAGAPLVGVPCPRCDQRTLTVHTDGPQHAWTITCTCICVGVGCTCRMPGAVEGVAHIWPRAEVLTGASKGESDRG